MHIYILPIKISNYGRCMVDLAPAPQQLVQPPVPPNQPIPAQPIQHMPQLIFQTGICR